MTIFINVRNLSCSLFWCLSMFSWIVYCWYCNKSLKLSKLTDVFAFYLTQLASVKIV